MQFSSPEAERETRRQIQQRRCQGTSESFNCFVLEMESLNGRLVNGFDEEELINLVRENMSPVLHSVTLTLEIHSIWQLRAVCQKYEILWSQSGFDPRKQVNTNRSHTASKFVSEIENNQTSNYDSLIDLQNLSFNDSRRCNESNELSAIQSKRIIACWNCKSPDHLFYDCPNQVDRKFGFGCGYDGVLKPNCPNCISRKLENRSPSGKSTGEFRSSQKQSQTNWNY